MFSVRAQTFTLEGGLLPAACNETTSKYNLLQAVRLVKWEYSGRRRVGLRGISLNLQAFVMRASITAILHFELALIQAATTLRRNRDETATKPLEFYRQNDETTRFYKIVIYM